MTESITTTTQFINTLGVNVHISQGTVNYGNAADIVADLQYLDAWNVRDGYNSYWLSDYTAVAQAGGKFDFISAVGGTVTTPDVTSFLSGVAAVDAAVPGSVAAIEGPNEINNWPITYNGVGGLQGAVNYQKALYSAVHADTALPGAVVYYFTGYNAGSDGIGPNPSTTPGLADYDTQHPYPNNNEPPLGWVNRTQALGNETPASGPAVYTETGYSSNDVGTTVQAKYTLDLLMDDAQSGISATYLYELMEEGDGSGLFDANNNPKPVATAIHDLTTILSAGGTTSAAAAAVNFSVGNLPSAGHDLSLTKTDGGTDIVVWNEPQISGTTAAPSTNVTVSLGATYASVEVFDPLQGTAPIETLSNVSSVVIGLTDHPLIVEVEPGSVVTPPPPPPPPPPPTTDTLTLVASEDAWKGNAEFIVKVNGTQVGGTRTASALHSAGDGNVFSLTGSWGSGVQSVQIQFINDAYGGTSTTDRNLYVNSIAYDGVTYAGTTATMDSNGTDTFSVGGKTPTAAAPADTLTLNLSENPWNGDAKFTLTIDGKTITTPQSVTALHSAGASEAFTFAGNFGTGTHTIGVNFTNSASGGTPSEDRTLYVNGISVNGTHYGSGVTTLLSDGTASFTVTTAH